MTVKKVSRALRRLAARLIRAPRASDGLLLRDAEFQILMMEFRYPPIQYSRVLAVNTLPPTVDLLSRALGHACCARHAEAFESPSAVDSSVFPDTACDVRRTPGLLSRLKT